MLIDIHSSLVSQDEQQNTWSDDIIKALEMLALAQKEGKHAVISNRPTLDKIRKCPHLSLSDRAVYNKAFNNFTKFQSYRSTVTKYIEINNQYKTQQICSDSGKTVIKIPPKFFNDSEIIQKTILLCENTHDAVLYETIAKVYLIWNNIKIQLACEHRGGGGSTIATEYSKIKQNQNRFCLCLVDSDQFAPNGSLGDTAKLIKNQANSNKINAGFIILDVREIENLIPISILSDLPELSQSKERQAALKVLEEIKNNDLRLFLDIKEGVILQNIISKTDANVCKFWQNSIPNEPNILGRIDIHCLSDWVCNSSSQCTCHVSLGLGKNILDNTISWLEKKSLHKVANMVEPSLRSQWENLGQEITNWCFAHKPIRA
ncbi:hypothetical protein [Coleofasciculus sp. F4-SAH-05]|uniref:hypothetical protein n=1 Tax=Coleofasciculus sp. F4-SAH-05 TaxID=3069525 RepID=UPI0032F44F8E